MTLEEANKYADEMDKLYDEHEEFIKKLMRVRCSDKHREFIEWLLAEETPCDACEYEEGSIYCKEHCLHEAKIEKEPCEDVTIDKHYWKGFNNGIRTEKFRESKRQESCGDAISRQYLLDNCVIDKVTMPYVPINKIQEAPPVNPTKTGHWIKHDNGKYHWYLCSCCNTMAGSDEKMMAYKYCPNCGAKMSESEEI